MDPDAALEEIRALAAKAVAGGEEVLSDPLSLLADLAIAFQELDDWLLCEGFLPSNWIGSMGATVKQLRSLKD